MCLLYLSYIPFGFNLEAYFIHYSFLTYNVLFLMSKDNILLCIFGKNNYFE